MKSVAVLAVMVLSINAWSAQKTVQLNTVTGETVSVTVEEIRRVITKTLPETGSKPTIEQDGRVLFSWPMVQVAGQWKYVDPDGAELFCKMKGFSKLLGREIKDIAFTPFIPLYFTVAKLIKEDGQIKVSIGNSLEAYSEIWCEL